MNKPVNAKIAKLLKNKGFDEPCNYYYELEYAHLYPENHVHRWDVLRHTKFKNSYQWEKAAAPTIAETIDWLYEKHGIWISVNNHLPRNEKRFDAHISKVILSPYNPSNLATFLHLTDLFNSPTEAYEAAIQYCLENLIIEQ